MPRERVSGVVALAPPTYKINYRVRTESYISLVSHTFVLYDLTLGSCNMYTQNEHSPYRFKQTQKRNTCRFCRARVEREKKTPKTLRLSIFDSTLYERRDAAQKAKI